MDNDNNIDFKDLWKKQSVSQPDMKDLLERVNTFKKAALRSLWIVNILLFATSAFIIFIWIYYQPQFVSTKIGIVLCVIAMVIYLFVANRLFGVYNKIDLFFILQSFAVSFVIYFFSFFVCGRSVIGFFDNSGHF